MNEATLEMLAYMALREKPHPDPRFPPSPYYRFLKLLAGHMRPNLSVELGVCGGGGSFHLAKGWKDGQAVGVDITYDHPENLAFIMSECPNFEFIKGDSIEAAKDIYDKFGPIDILFIDTVHEYDHTMDEFKAYQPYLSDSGIVCLDDLFRPRMLNVWNDLPGDKVRLDDLHTGGGDLDGGFGAIFNVK